MKNVLILAAMPGELSPLVRGWQHESRNGVDLWHRSSADGEWVAACAGAGQERATRAFAEAERVLSRSGEGIDLVISTGWAGALEGKYAAGQVYWVLGVIDVRTGERFPAEKVGDLGGSSPRSQNRDLGHPDSTISEGTWALKGHGFSRATETQNIDAALAAEGMPEENRAIPQGLEPGNPNSTANGTAEAVPIQSTPIPSMLYRDNSFHHELWLATSPRVADEAEKQRLASTYHAALVDMEASAIARAAQRRGIAFFCCKGVSDGYTDHLPDFNAFIAKNGKFQLARFVVFALLRPGYWSALIRMGENSKKSAQGIKESILAFLDQE